MSRTASLVTTYTMQQCFNVLPNIYKVFLLLFHCCIMLENKTYNNCYCYYCYRLYLIWLVWTGLQFCTDLCSSASFFRQMQLGNSHDILHMLNSSCKAVSSAVAPHIHWITSCSSTSMHRPLSLGLGTTGTVARKVQTTVLVHVGGTYIRQVTIYWFFSNFTLFDVWSTT